MTFFRILFFICSIQSVFAQTLPERFQVVREYVQHIPHTYTTSIKPEYNDSIFRVTAQVATDSIRHTPHEAYGYFLRAFCKVHIIKKSIDTISSNEISIQYIIDTIAVIADLNKAIQLDPTLDEAYEERFSFYQYRHPSLALKDINTLIANHPDSLSYFLTRKTLHYENNNFLLAFSDLEKCYELGYSRHTYLFEKGDIYIQLKQYDKAVIIYTTLLESSDKMKKESKGFILFKRGLAYFHLQKFQLSLNDFNNALSIGNYNWGMYYKGICLHELGHKKEACEVWNERLGTIFLDYSLYNKLQKLIEKKCN